jgi:hypothetical protein
MARIGSSLVIALLFVSSCGSSGSDAPRVCSKRSGTYRIAYTERSGTCGAIPEQMRTLDAQPTVPLPPCTSGEIRYSADNCEVTNINIVCPEDAVAPAATSTTNGKETWNEDGSRGVGEMTILVKDSAGLGICQSSYDVVATRL